MEDSLLGFSASSDPGALDDNCTSYHIIHSPVVLKEQKCDEGREKEGNREVLIQGADSWSVERRRQGLKCFQENWVVFGIKLLKNNYLRWKRDISCRHYKHPVRLNQNWRVARNNSESDKKFPWSGSTCSPDAHNLKGEWDRSCHFSSWRFLQNL